MSTQLRNIHTFKEFDQFLDGASARVSFWGFREVAIPKEQELIALGWLCALVDSLIDKNPSPGRSERLLARKVIEKINGLYLNIEETTIQNIFTSIFFIVNNWITSLGSCGYGPREDWHLDQAKFDRYTLGTAKIEPVSKLLKNGPLSDAEIQLSRIFTLKEIDQFLDGAKVEVSFWGNRLVTIPNTGLTFTVDTLPYFVKKLVPRTPTLNKSERFYGRKVVRIVNDFFAKTEISSIRNPITLIFFLFHEFCAAYLNGGRYNSRNNWHRRSTQREFSYNLSETAFLRTCPNFFQRVRDRL
ncbi:MAG: hypothetical protein P0S96_01540 [Simkaniaceae bacterium]|nr:hypothetical protein [Candidatus Sacchlamyda saccharinae]